jgi:LuxR family maltose regulon positive regulatory protein
VHHTDLLDDEIARSIRSASFEEATEALVAGWRGYLPDRGQVLAERIRALPERYWESNPPLLYALACSHRAAGSSNPFAALAYFEAAEAALVDHADPQLSVLVGVGRVRALRGLGRLLDARSQACAVRESIGGLGIGMTTRLELEATLLAEEGICLALMGELDAAARQVRHGLALGGERPSPPMIEALGCLALVEYLAGGFAAPRTQLDRVAGMLGDSLPLEAAPALITEALLAIDEGDTGRARERVDLAAGLARDTEYAVFALHVDAILRAGSDGPLEQLELLQAVQLVMHDWQAPALIRSLHDTERVWALLQLGSIGAARDAVAEASKKTPLQTGHVHCPARAAARLALHTGDFEAVLAITSACRAMGDRHAPRSLACIEVLRAAAHDALGDAATAAETMDRALLAAARTGWRRQFTSLPHARLSSLISSARRRPQPAATAAVLSDLRRRLCPDDVTPIAPLSSRERIILGRIVAGETRQQMSSQLSVSPNTVKAQVRSIYRKLGASNRHEAIDRAARYGITT